VKNDRLHHHDRLRKGFSEKNLACGVLPVAHFLSQNNLGCAAFCFIEMQMRLARVPQLTPSGRSLQLFVSILIETF